MTDLRTAVIGLGRIGWRYHVPSVVQHDGFELVAVVDPLKERLEEAKSEYGVSGYADPDSLWDTQDLDLIVIASPTKFHCPQAISAFEHGCHVFCDKPMAFSLKEADLMIDAMNRHGKKLMVYQPHRASAEMVALKEILRRNIIGSVYMIRYSRESYARRNDWQAFSKHGGGMLNNYGAHHVDQCLHIAGSKAKRITCALRTIASLGDADDVVKAVIETENGVIIDIDINMATAYPETGWQVLGEFGSANLDGKGWKVRYFRPEELEDVKIQQGLAASDRRYGSGEAIPWREEFFPLSDFRKVDFYEKCYEYFALDKPPFVPVAETREVMRVLHECRKDSSSKGGE